MVRVCSTFVVLAVALVVSLNACLAKETNMGEKKPVKAEEVFKRLDKDNNGKLSKDEFAAPAKDPEKAKAVFDKIDTNRDGAVSLDEFKAWAKKMEARAKKKEGSGKKPEKK